MLIPVRKSLVLLCVFIAISMQYVIPMVNNISVNASNALMQMEYTGSSGNNKKTMSNQQTNLSKSSCFCSMLFWWNGKNNTVFSYVTNGKNETMDIGAERFYDYITNSTDALSGYDGEPSNKSGRSSSSFFLEENMTDGLLLSLGYQRFLPFWRY